MGSTLGSISRPSRRRRDLQRRDRRVGWQLGAMLYEINALPWSFDAGPNCSVDADTDQDGSVPWPLLAVAAVGRRVILVAAGFIGRGAGPLAGNFRTVTETTSQLALGWVYSRRWRHPGGLPGGELASTPCREGPEGRGSGWIRHGLRELLRRNLRRFGFDELLEATRQSGRRNTFASAP